MTGKGHKKTIKAPAPAKKRQDSDSDDVPYEEMSEEQKRQYDVALFARRLDRTKPYFEQMDRQVIPIVEAFEDEEVSADSQARIERSPEPEEG